jgi:hypothetical protein
MVKFDGLPENVVPIAKMSQTIECTMKSDQIRKVERGASQFLHDRLCITRQDTTI